MRARSWVAGLAVAGLLAGATSARATGGASGGQRTFEASVVNDASTDNLEPSVAVNPTDPRNVIITYNQMNEQLSHYEQVPKPRQVWSPVQSCGVAVTNDGGLTWVRRQTPSYDPPVHDPVMTNCSDQLVIFDEHGTAYLLSSHFNTAFAADEERMMISRDGGATWSAPVLVAPTTFSGGQNPTTHHYLASGDANRAWLALDESTGTLYMDGSEVWIDDAAVEHNVVYMVSSRDGGHSWSEQTMVNGPVPTGTVQNNPGVAAAHGMAVVAYDPPSTPASPPVCSCVELAITTDGAKTFVHRKTPIPKAGGALLDAPLIAADPTHAGRFAVLVPDPAGTHLQVWVTDDTGSSWRKPVLLGEGPPNTRSHTWIAYSATGLLAAMWRTYYNDGSYSVWSAVSGDGGTTFGPPVPMSSRRSPPPPPTYVAGDDTGTLAFTPNAVYVAWADWRTGNGGTIWWAGLPTRAGAR